MPSVDLIHVFRLFFESNILGIKGNNVTKCWGNEPYKN